MTNNFKNKFIFIIILLLSFTFAGLSTNNQSVNDKTVTENSFDVKELDLREILSRRRYQFLSSDNILAEMELTPEDFEIIGFTNIIPEITPIYEEEYSSHLLIYEVIAGDSLYTIARKYDTTIEKIKSINNLQTDVIYVEQELKIPVEHFDGDIEGETLIYIVSEGDSLYKIAQEFNTTVRAIKDLNNLDSSMIIVGQHLEIYLGDPETEETIYTVQPGDSLYLIAQEFDTTAKAIGAKNNLESNIIYPGQELIIPEEDCQEEEPEEEQPYRKYTVQSGDSLYLISRRFNVSVDEIMEINNLNSEMIYRGQILDIPVDQSVPDISLEYTVEQWDTVESIADDYGVSAERIRSYNNINSVSQGQTINIPISIPIGVMREGRWITQRELNLMARAVYSEARGEPFKGQVAVAAVIFNRVDSSYFPDNINDVIFQPWQFTAVHDGQFWLEPNQQSYLAVRAALEGWDPSNGAIYYYNPDTATSEWIFYRNVIIRIGDHLFAV